MLKIRYKTHRIRWKHIQLLALHTSFVMYYWLYVHVEIVVLLQSCCGMSVLSQLHVQSYLCTSKSIHVLTHLNPQHDTQCSLLLLPDYTFFLLLWLQTQKYKRILSKATQELFYRQAPQQHLLKRMDSLYLQIRVSCVTASCPY